MHPHRRHLKKADPRLAGIMEKITLPDFKATSDYFRFLVESIISQQLSVKASDTIIGRFIKLFGGKKFPLPKDVLVMPIETMRSAGLSGAKTAYIRDLAEKIRSKTIILKHIHELEDEAVIEYLIQVKGIGRWTAEMFLIFALGREDIFSHGDLGLRNALKKLYGWRTEPSRKKIESVVKKWSPYRSYASRYLWKSLDNE